jgi:Flp pilus assembly protein TadD
MGNFIIIVLFLGILFLAVRPFTIIAHELGHAIPAILLTRQVVTIYLGSYGDPNRSLHFKIGLLEVWFKYNPFMWREGLCVPSAPDISFNNRIIYILGGPIVSVIFGALTCYFAFGFDVHAIFKLIFIVFFCSTIFDLLVNLIPIDHAILLHDGTVTYNDGTQLKLLFRVRKYSAEYLYAKKMYKLRQFEQAGKTLEYIIKQGWEDQHLYRICILCFFETQNFQLAKEMCDAFMKLDVLSSDDYVKTGVVYLYLGQNEESLRFNNTAIGIDPTNKCALNNNGYTLTVLNRFEEAIPYLDKAIEIDNNLACAYNNRGLAKIKTDKLEEGFEDINHSLKLDENNSYAYRNLGIYHLDKGAHLEALPLLIKAKELDSTTLMIDELISLACRND